MLFRQNHENSCNLLSDLRLLEILLLLFDKQIVKLQRTLHTPDHSYASIFLAPVCRERQYQKISLHSLEELDQWPSFRNKSSLEAHPASDMKISHGSERKLSKYLGKADEKQSRLQIAFGESSPDWIR
jgi:hypothetical protein